MGNRLLKHVQPFGDLLDHALVKQSLFPWNLPFVSSKIVLQSIIVYRNRSHVHHFHGHHNHQRMLSSVFTGSQKILETAVQQISTQRLRPHRVCDSNCRHLLHIGTAEIQQATWPRKPTNCHGLDAELHAAIYTDWPAENTVSLFENRTQPIGSTVHWPHLYLNCFYRRSERLYFSLAC